MRILRLTTAYPAYLRSFYSARPGLLRASYAEQKAALDHDAFGWVDSWSHAMTLRGHEMLDVLANAAPLQRAWAKDHGLHRLQRDHLQRVDLLQIAIHQARELEPDVLWFDDCNTVLLQAMREAAPSIRLVVGWSGSAVPQTNIWSQMHLVLSCATESVDSLRAAGARAEQLHHAFDPRIGPRLAAVRANSESIDVSFIGQIIQSRDFHMERARMLEDICRHVNLQIFTPNVGLGARDLYMALRLGWQHNPDVLAAMIGGVRKILKSRTASAADAVAGLRPHLHPAVFGLSMYDVIRRSALTLNIHADSSPRAASNMRLFETTGVGTCLLTDWRANLAEMFNPDTELVTYRHAAECIERIRWLVDNPTARRAIASAGRARTLRDHTFERRSEELEAILQKEMGKC